MDALEGESGPYSTWLELAGRALTSGLAELVQGTLRVERISGGGNNALYRLEVADSQHQGEYALKLFVADERRRAFREFHSLSLLAEAGLDLGPEPLYLDESTRLAPYPAVIYRWLPGSSPQFTPELIERLVVDVQALRGLHPQDWAGYDLPNAIFHHFEFDFYLREQCRMLAAYGPWLSLQGCSGARLAGRIAGIVAACRKQVRLSQVNPNLRSSLRGLCRLDYNRTNAILSSDGCLRWVDWEYAGWGDPALELADLRWHASLDDLDPVLHARLRNSYRPAAEDDEFYARLALWDQVVLARWPLLVARLLWSRSNGPDRPRLSQLDEEPRVLWERLERMVVRAEEAIAL